MGRRVTYEFTARELMEARPSFTALLSAAVRATGKRREVLVLVLEKRLAEARKA